MVDPDISIQNLKNIVSCLELDVPIGFVKAEWSRPFKGGQKELPQDPGGLFGWKKGVFCPDFEGGPPPKKKKLQYVNGTYNSYVS